MSTSVAYLSEKEFSQRYGIAPRTLQRWRSEGSGPAYVRFGSRRVLYRVSDAEKWAKERTFTHRADELARAATAKAAA